MCIDRRKRFPFGGVTPIGCLAVGEQSIVTLLTGLVPSSVGRVELATGWSAGQLKIGSFARSERVANWNEGIRIETGDAPPARFKKSAVRRVQFSAGWPAE